MSETSAHPPAPRAGTPAWASSLPPGPRRPSLGRGWTRLAAATQLLLTVSLLYTVARGATSAWTVSVVAPWVDDPRQIDVAQANQVDSLALWTSIGGIPVLVVTGVLFITWLYRAHRSDRMYPPALRHGSGWAIGGWFVPILNFWRPYQMVDDVRRGAQEVDLGKGRGLVLAWWLTCVGGTVAGRVSAALYPEGDERPQALLRALHHSAVADVVASSLDTVALVLAVLVVRRLTDMVEVSPHGTRPA